MLSDMKKVVLSDTKTKRKLMSVNTNQQIKFRDYVTNSSETVLDRIIDDGRGQDDYMIDIRL